MKKVFSLLLCLILVIGCFPLTALADDTTLGDDDETTITLTATVPVVLASITVTPPTKTEYNVGESLDKAGMVVTATYNDESTKDVTADAALSGFDSSAAGEVTVSVSYTEGDVTKTATFTVTIVEPVVTTYTISVSADPAEGGTVSGGGTYSENASVTVTATANDNYTLQSTTIISKADMQAGNYNQTTGCFYLEDDGKVYYKLPSRCSFTAPEGKEFDCWEASFGGTFNCGATFNMAEKGNFTITALWKEIVPEPDPYLTLSIPATLDINYGDTQTPFDIQVKEGVFPNDRSNFEVLFPYSSFQCTSHDGTIPFTVTTNATGVPNGHHGDKGYFAIMYETPLPFICQGFINITSDDWVAAKPGNYTATLRVQVSWIA